MAVFLGSLRGGVMAVLSMLTTAVQQTAIHKHDDGQETISISALSCIHKHGHPIKELAMVSVSSYVMTHGRHRFIKLTCPVKSRRRQPCGRCSQGRQPTTMPSPAMRRPCLGGPRCAPQRL